MRNVTRPRRPECGAAGRPGAATVEFAVIAPVIFLAIFGLIEVGRVFMVLHGLETSAREGCRTAILYGATQQEVDQVLTSRLATFGIKGYQTATSPSPPSQAKQFEQVTVRVTVPYRNICLFPVLGDLFEVNLHGTCTMPKESADVAS
jgi:Flp pilus assembly protein TadG